MLVIIGALRHYIGIGYSFPRHWELSSFASRRRAAMQHNLAMGLSDMVGL